MENNQKEIILLEDLGMLYTTSTYKYKRRYGLYKCHCQNIFKTQIQSIKNGHCKSCGCEKGNRNHNSYNHRLYNTWQQMIYRCINPNNKSYKYYGAKGIKVCDEWLDFNNFINDMYSAYKEGLTLDRENPEGDYCKNNCRWVTKTVQARNTQRLRKDNSSGFRGTSFDKNKKRWVSRIGINSKNIHLGYFDTALDGAKAYDNYIIQNNLEHTKNF